MDEKAFDGVDTLVHLAGAGIAEKRWTPQRKKEILDTRVKSTALLVDFVRSKTHSLKTVIAASAIGYYGIGIEDKLLSETDQAGTNFLATVVVEWEKESAKFQSAGLRLVQVRTGIVLSNRGGALKEMTWPVRLGIGAPLGSGRQIMSWIHIDDLCALFVWAIENKSVSGIFNAAAPNPVSNREFSVALGRQLGRPVWIPFIPGLALRLLLGEMADLVLNGSRISCEKALKNGFRFRYSQLDDALRDLFPK